MNCDQRKQEPNSSPNEGGRGPQSCLRNTRNTWTPTHTPTHTAVFLLHGPFWTVYLDTGKGQGLVYISLCTKRKLHRPWTWGCVTSVHVCVLYTVCSYFKIKLGLLLMLVRNYGHQQEARRTDNELNRDSPFLTEVAGNRFAFGYQMTNWTMFLHDSLKN